VTAKSPGFTGERDDEVELDNEVALNDDAVEGDVSLDELNPCIAVSLVHATSIATMATTMIRFARCLTILGRRGGALGFRQTQIGSPLS
jgi:hypothetical protein